MNHEKRVVIWYMSLAHAVVHIFEMAIPILMTVWLLEFSISEAVLGSVVAVGYGLFGVGALPSGVLVDKYDSQLFIVLCMAGMGISFLVLSLATNLALLTAALALWGLAGSIYHPASLAMLSKVFDDENRGKAFGYHGIGNNVGIVVGPLATAVMLLAFDWQFVTALLAVPGLAVAAIGLFIEIDEISTVDDDERTVQADGSSEHIRLGAFLADAKYLFAGGFTIVFVIVMFNGLFYRGLLTFLPDILGNLLDGTVDPVALLNTDDPVIADIDLGQYVFSALLVVGIAGQYVGGTLSDRIPIERGLAMILGVLSITTLIFVPVMMIGLVPMIVVAAVVSFIVFALQPFTQATVAAYSPPELRGLSYGFTYLSIFGIGALGSVIVGITLTYSTISAVFLVLAMIAALGCLTALALGIYGQRTE